MLARMQRKGNPPTLLVGIQAVAATPEDNMKVPQEVKNRATLWLSSCTTGYLFTDVVKIQGTRIPVFIAAMSTIAKLWKELRCPSTDDWINKLRSIYTMEYYSVIRKDEYPPYASTWMELEGIMLSEISQAEKNNYHMASLICGT